MHLLTGGSPVTSLGFAAFSVSSQSCNFLRATLTLTFALLQWPCETKGGVVTLPISDERVEPFPSIAAMFSQRGVPMVWAR